MAQSRPTKPAQLEISPRGIVQLATILVAVVAIIYLVLSGLYSVKAHERAVVFRFGKYLTDKQPGLHLKFPWIDERIIVDTTERPIRLPHPSMDSPKQRGRAVPASEQEDKLILTGDLFAAVVEWNVYWQVTEPKDFVINFNGDEGEIHELIAALAKSVMHRAVGDYSAEEVLTGKREEITQLAFKELSEKMASYESGITITSIQMQRVTPPDRVKPSFDEVNASIQQRDQLVNEAWRDRNKLIPAAEAQRDKLIREAEGYASRELAEAQGKITALLSKYESYKLAPEATRQRLYIETMERILEQSGPKILLDHGINPPLPLLNLNGGTPFAPQGKQGETH